MSNQSSASVNMFPPIADYGFLSNCEQSCLVAPDGSAFTVTDQKGKKQKYQVYAREGYSAPQGAVN